MTMRLMKAAALLTLLLPAANALAEPGNDAKAGQILFGNPATSGANGYSCYSCHGYSGQNGPGMRLVPMTMTKANFIARIRNPAEPNRMPPFSAQVLSDEQAGDIWAYIRTLPVSPAAKDIPLLQSELKENK